MINTLLIANRGEIAIRILRAARELGITTVAVYSEDDAAALHVEQADQACALKGQGASAYLDMSQLIAIAQEQQVDAIHPGYGFLSESADFAQRCKACDINFIGPTVEQLLLFGDKVKARAVAERSDVPCIDGTGKASTLAEAKTFFQSLAGQTKSPAMMIKAVSGGGGRGMRAVKHSDQIEEAYARCQSEAKASFGNGDVYVERLIEAPRHIEVQIIGDGTGAVTHLWERECSIQRRHQKVVEIAPSPDLGDAMRKQLTDAAIRIGQQCHYKGLGTVEFLLDGVNQGQFYFIEVNPRIQVEHTVTEEIFRLDLVKAQIAIANGQTLKDIRYDQSAIRPPEAYALQLRITMETLNADGSTTPSHGQITRFDMPSGPGIRIDTAGYLGYTPSPLFDSLLAKVIVCSSGGDYHAVVNRAAQALREMHIDGVATNSRFLQNLLNHPDFKDHNITTGFVDQHLQALTADTDIDPNRRPPPPHQQNSVAASVPQQSIKLLEGQAALCSPLQGVIVEVSVLQGQQVVSGQQVAVVEAMKMEHLICADHSGWVEQLCVEPGETIQCDQPVIILKKGEQHEAQQVAEVPLDLDHIRDDLADVFQRQQALLDQARPEAVLKRHQRGQRTARENIDDLVDAGSFREYGGLAVAAQRAKYSLEQLIKKTPADGLITGLATVNGSDFPAEKSRCMIMAYDAMVYAGTQGYTAHKKKDRMLALAMEQQLPIVLFAEGGGGRPGDTEGGIIVETPSFLKYAQLSGKVPLIAITTRYCFAGNAALLGCSDVIIATRNACIGMAGPSLIEGGGLGRFKARDIGPVDVQAPNGAVDIVVQDEQEAVAVAKRYLSYFQGPLTDWTCDDQRKLRQLIPEKRSRTFDIRALINTLADTGTVLELREAFAPGMITSLVRIEGQAFGLIANNGQQLGGAIESDAADKAARFMRLCNAFTIPLIHLIDTPGFMVGPEAEKTAQVRHFSRLFVAAAACRVPSFSIVLRKAYGLGALSMTGGSFHRQVFSVSWPTGEFGGMGLEGAVKLGYAAELNAITDMDKRQALYDQLLSKHREAGKAINMASHVEIDNVIDPMETRSWLVEGYKASKKNNKLNPSCDHFIDTW